MLRDSPSNKGRTESPCCGQDVLLCHSPACCRVTPLLYPMSDHVRCNMEAREKPPIGLLSGGLYVERSSGYAWASQCVGLQTNPEGCRRLAQRELGNPKSSSAHFFVWLWSSGACMDARDCGLLAVGCLSRYQPPLSELDVNGEGASRRSKVSLEECRLSNLAQQRTLAS